MRKFPSEPPQAEPESGRSWSIVWRLLPYLWPANEPALRFRMVVALSLLVLAKVVNVYVPIFFKQAVDALTLEGDSAPQAGAADAAQAATGLSGTELALVAVPIGLIVAYGLARLGHQALNELRDLVFARLVERAMHKVGLQTFRHLHALSLRFHLDRQTGGLSRVIERGTRGIEVILRMFAFRSGPALIELLMVCVVLWTFYDWTFPAVLVATLAAYVVWTLMITEWRLGFRRTMNTHDAEANTKAVDSLLNYETVKYFGNESHEARRFDRALAAYEDAAVYSHSSLSVLNIGQGAIIGIGLVILMIMAAQGIVDGRMTAGDFVLVNAYLLNLYIPLNFLGMVYREIKQAITDMEIMFGLLDTPPEVVDPPESPALAVSGGEIRFEEVEFSYNPDRPILKGISFTVPAGKTVALVGPSGAGKSTISRLLFRFYDVTAGRVTIDGQDVRDVSQDSLRAAIGIVPQDTVLFNDTIGYNIGYGNPEADQEALEQAARMAQIDRFIGALPETWETRVGERGLKLSGGEKQRVAIARTILKDPAILMFDEATSQLDSHTEQEIQSALRQVSKGRTTLVIAHRLSTVVDADEILVLEEGRIFERGTHAALMSADGAYAAMWRRQQEAARREIAAQEDARAEAELADQMERSVMPPADVPM